MGEIDLIPAQVCKLGRPQAVAEGDKDHGGIPERLTLAASISRSTSAPVRCSLGEVGSPQLHFEIRKGFSPVDPLQFLNGA